MYIIFGKDQAQELEKKYTVLELDTFRLGENGPVVTAYCTVETIPLEELVHLTDTKQQHECLIINYCNQAWQDCLTGIDQLMGKWHGELDSFYADLQARVENYAQNPPSADWSPIIQK